MNKVTAVSLALFSALLFAEAENEIPAPNFALVTGGGSSIKGFGDTDQIVYTADVMARYARPLFRLDKWWLKGRHEMWIETPIAFIIHDSDSVDQHDVSIAGFSVLAVWVFPEIKGLEPYLLAGGGGRYLFADIAGMGNDICGNYQLGAGTLFFKGAHHPISIEMRYDHISNGSTAEPNVPLNSVKILLGFHL